MSGNVRPPEPEMFGDVPLCWHLYPRAVVSRTLDEKTGLYQDICDFKAKEFSLTISDRICDDSAGGTQYWLRQGEMISIGLGISFDFEEKFWYCGFFSIRKEEGLDRGLENVANNPIFAEERNRPKREKVIYIKNNGDAQYIGRNEALFQVHFSECLRFPKVSIVDDF